MRFLPIPSLRWRLVVVMCLAYIIVALATEIVGLNTQRQHLESQLKTRARADAVILAAGAVLPLQRQSPNARTFALNNFLNSLGRGTEEVRRVTLYGNNGCAVVSYPPPVPKTCIPAPFSPESKASGTPAGDFRGSSPITAPDNVLGLAVVVLSGQSVNNDLRDTLNTDLVLRGAGLILFLILSLAIARYILGPLSGLVAASRSIRHGELAVRVPVAGHSELAMLAEAFNDMASALEQRIRHLSFLATAASVLPSDFRDRGDATATLKEFCAQLETRGAGLLPRLEGDQFNAWYELEPQNPPWRPAAEVVARSINGPTAVVEDGWAIMAVPVLGETIFVTARGGDHPFSQEEQQVVANFAYQLGIAADNARLFEEQQEALQVKDQFLSIVSHELRTPLTTIKGYAQMLRRKLTDEPDGQRYATNIDAQVGRLARLVDDLLDVTRFARGEFELKRQRVDMRSLLEDAIARFRIVAPRHTFVLNLDDGASQGSWDRDRLEQVMNNLIGNAVKYSPTGGTVTVSTRHEGAQLLVAVRDQGVGIPEQDQAHLFERFFRGMAERGDIQGLGLGLYVTRRIIEAHGGTIGVHSRPNEGSEFYFSLPLAPHLAAASSGR